MKLHGDNLADVIEERDKEMDALLKEWKDKENSVRNNCLMLVV